VKFRFYPGANKRLDEIWRYTTEHWDEEQAELYIKGLFDSLEERAMRKHLWRAVRETGFTGVYFFRYEHHFIFFRELDEGEIGVISIIHEKMDIPHRLREDSSQQ